MQTSNSGPGERIQLDPNEKIILKTRKHIFSLIAESSFLGFLVVAPPIFYAVLKKAQMIHGVPSDYLFIFSYSIIILFCWVIFAMSWTDYFLDVLVVTDKRILDIEQKGFFNREVATVRLDRIQDITIQVKGILATFIDFGDIYIQTAGESREFVVKYIPNPKKVKDTIYELHAKQIETPQSVKVIQ